MRISQLSRRGLATLAAIVAAFTAAGGTAALTHTADSSPVVAASPQSDWQTVHDLACANGAINCGPDVTTTTTTIGGSTSSSVSGSTTTALPSTTTTTQPATTTTGTTTTTVAPTTTQVATTTTTAAPTTTTTAPPTTTTAPQPPSIQPDASNTGVPKGTTLTNYSGCSIPAGATVDAKTFNCGSLSVGSNVTITRSKINGSSFSVIQNPGSGLKISDSELSCSRYDGSYGINGGSNATFTRLNVHDCENAIEPGNNVIFQDSWLHNMWAQSAGHNDGISIDGGVTNVKILRNNINMAGCSGCGTPTSSIMVDNYFGGTTSGLLIDGNWLQGGQFVQYFDTQFGAGTISATLTNNHFAGGVFGFCNRSASKVTLSQSGNTPDPSPC